MEEGRLGQEENAGVGRKGPGQMTSAGSRPGRPAAGLSIQGGRSRGPENSPRREWLRHSSTMVTRGHGGLGTQGAKVSCEGDPGVRPGRPQTVKNGAPCVSDILAVESLHVVRAARVQNSGIKASQRTNGSFTSGLKLGIRIPPIKIAKTRRGHEPHGVPPPRITW